MRRLLSSRRRKLVAFGAVLALAASGAALAAWLTTGTGSGYGHIGTLQPVTFSPGQPTGAAAFPGSPGDMVVTADNPNSTSLFITDITPCQQTCNFVTAQDTTDGTCTGSYASASGSQMNVEVPPGSNDVIVPGVVNLDASTPSACQGHDLILYFDASLTT